MRFLGCKLSATKQNKFMDILWQLLGREMIKKYFPEGGKIEINFKIPILSWDL